MAKQAKLGGSIQNQAGARGGSMGKGGGKYSSGKGGGMHGTNNGPTSNVRMSNEMRSDMTSEVTKKNPYPKGLA